MRRGTTLIAYPPGGAVSPLPDQGLIMSRDGTTQKKAAQGYTAPTIARGPVLPFPFIPPRLYDLPRRAESTRPAPEPEVAE
jgi:hypothetical protein